MHRLLNSARNNNPTNLNKPLPEPLVDPDEGKTPIGELVIIPIQGRDLPNRERFGKQDPFILFRLGNVSKRSMTDVRGGQRPLWKDDQVNIFMYESDAKDAKSLYVTCLDEDPKKNDLIGDCVINLAKVLEQGEHDDWFELSYKGREAGELLLQLTYFSHDPTHPTNKMNRPASTAPLRRSIHPTKEQKPESKPVEEEPHVDEGPVYKPPAAAEAAVYKDPVVPAQVPMVGAAGYPYGTVGHAAGRPVSPAGPAGAGHYVGHHTPHIPAVNPLAAYSQQPANPYAAPATAAYPGYPTAAGAAPGVYPGQVPHDPLSADPTKRLSFNGQPAGYPGAHGVPGVPVAPVAGYPGAHGGPIAPVAPVAGYPAQVAPVGGFGAQTHSPSFPPTSAYPPQNANVGGYPSNTGYPPAAGTSPFAVAQQLPILAGGAPAAGGPPAGYPFGASNIYPPNNNANNNANSNFGGNSNNSFNNNNGVNNGGNFNNNNGGNFNNNNGSTFNNNNNSNGNNFNNNNSNASGFNNNGSMNGNNFNGQNNGGNFNNSNTNNNNNNNNGANFGSNRNNFNNNNNSSNNNFNNNSNNNFNSNGSNNNFNSNSSSNNFNSNNSNNSNFNNNSFNNNSSNSNNNRGSNNFNNNSSSNSGYTMGGYSSPNMGNNNNNNNNNNFPKATPVVPKPVVSSSVGQSMYGPDGF